MTVPPPPLPGDRRALGGGGLQGGGEACRAFREGLRLRVRAPLVGALGGRVLGWGGSQHANSPNTPTTGLREHGNDTSKSTGRSGRQNAATRCNMRREDRVTVQGPVKEQQPDGMSHGGSCLLRPCGGFRGTPVAASLKPSPFWSAPAVGGPCAPLRWSALPRHAPQENKFRQWRLPVYKSITRDMQGRFCTRFRCPQEGRIGRRTYPSE